MLQSLRGLNNPGLGQGWKLQGQKSELRGWGRDGSRTCYAGQAKYWVLSYKRGFFFPQPPGSCRCYIYVFLCIYVCMFVCM